MLTALIAAAAIQFGVSANQPIGSEDVIDYRESVGAHLQIGVKEKPVYFWSTASKGKTYVLGQPIASVYTIGAGLGYRKEFNDTFYWYANVGAGYPHNVNNYGIQQEVAYTYLVGRHAVENRPIPVDVLYPYDQDSYATTWDVDYGVMTKVGVGFKATEHTRIDFGYKYFNPKGVIEIYDPEMRAAGLGFWQEYVTINMNVVEMSFSLAF